MISFTTETGSVYELDEEGKQIRRVSGTHSATAHQSPDGEWQTYLSATPVVKGKVVRIVWRVDYEGTPGAIIRRTITSRVAHIAPGGSNEEDPHASLGRAS